jgi:hypothetical protein
MKRKRILASPRIYRHQKTKGSFIRDIETLVVKVFHYAGPINSWGNFID